MPANDRGWTHNYYRVTPTAQSRQHCEADAAGVIEPPRPDTALDVGCKLLAKHEILGADFAGWSQERSCDPQKVANDFGDSSRDGQHPSIMADSTVG